MHGSDKVSIEYDDDGVLRTVYTLPGTSSDLPSVLALSLPKAGSVLLDKLMAELSSIMGMTYVSIMGEFFNLGIRAADAPASTSQIFLDRGYCYGGFRFLPDSFEIPILGRAKSVLLVRDPRDMLVSHYFSTRSSHPAPGSKSTLKTGMREMPLKELAQSTLIDEYVIKFSRFYRRHMTRYIDELAGEGHDKIRVYRYEDVIFEKRRWIADMCAWFGWDVSEKEIHALADKNDLRPTSEDEAQHVRQATPGDHKRKLKPETIEELTEIFDKELAYFGYDSAAVKAG